MKKLFLIGATALMVSNSTFAGGILTNTNQNATFLRNPARNAAIAIDGVYSNPAGIAFMPQGFHLSASWQAAFQKRQMNVTDPLFAANADNNSTSRTFEGTAKAPVIPSIQAAYVINDKWSVSAQFAVGGGGGKCEFDEGLPMFEQMIGYTIYQAMGNQATPYALNQNLTGEQYFYGLQVGGTYKIAENVSVFGGLRTVLASCAYTGALTGLKANGLTAEQLNAYGMAEMAAKLQDYNLDCSQSGIGFTPIIGIDWNLGKLNLAAKYEFRTKIELENESKNSQNVDVLMPAYANGAKVRSDIPSILTLGAQYQITDNVRAMVGGVYYWDKDAKTGLPSENKYAINYGDNTWEANLGIEWDVNDKILLSCGAQRTEYGFDDKDIADTNFNTSSYAVAIGGAYKFSEKMRLNVGYMHSFYDNHKFTHATYKGSSCDYTRKNDALGVSLDITF